MATKYRVTYTAEYETFIEIEPGAYLSEEIDSISPPENEDNALASGSIEILEVFDETNAKSVENWEEL